MRGTTVGLIVVKNGLTISIHVPREGDDGDQNNRQAYHAISIHVPREGDDDRWHLLHWIRQTFQSTSPVRGTTIMPVNMATKRFISIHVPREGDDWLLVMRPFLMPVFQSTSPVRGTTGRW